MGWIVAFKAFGYQWLYASNSLGWMTLCLFKFFDLSVYEKSYSITFSIEYWREHYELSISSMKVKD